MSLCGEGGAACVGNVRWYVQGDSSSRHVLTIALGGRVHQGEGGRGGSANAACAQLEEGAHPHRSRGEALVRLSIPNVLRCLEFFFPDRRYLCRAARGSHFCGEEGYRTAFAGGRRRPVLGRFVSMSLQLQLTGIRRTLLTLPRSPGVYFDRPQMRKGKKRNNQIKRLLCTLLIRRKLTTGQSDDPDETRCVRAKTAAVQTGPRGSHSCHSGAPSMPRNTATAVGEKRVFGGCERPARSTLSQQLPCVWAAPPAVVAQLRPSGAAASLGRTS